MLNQSNHHSQPHPRRTATVSPGRTGGALWLLAVLAVSAPAEEGSRTGTIEGVLNGEPTVWYINDSGEVAGATWTEPAPGRYRAVLVGFESRGKAVAGSQITLSFGFTPGEAAARHPLTGSPQSPGWLQILPSTDDLSVLHTAQQGELNVNRIEAGADGAFRFAGSFRGTLADEDGRIVGELAAGRFEVSQARQMEPR